MAHYAVGQFEYGQSRSPYQFVCKNLQPQGPYALLDTKRRRIGRPETSTTYLFEMEDWHSIDQCKQYVTKIIAPLKDIHFCLYEALKSAEWEMVTEHGRRKIRVVGGILKTEYGYFTPVYYSGLNAFGSGQDVNPRIVFASCARSVENPYGEALGTALAQGLLMCFDSVEIKRAKDAFIAKQDLGELLAAKMAGNR